MPDAVLDKGLLAQALAKVNAVAPGASPALTTEEIQALRAFVVAKAGQPLTDREQEFVGRVRAVVEAEADAAAEALDTERRKNAMLRSAIDKCLHGEAATLDPAEREILGNTAAQLDAIADPSASHLRLRGLVMQAVQALAALADAQLGSGPLVEAIRAEAAPDGIVRVDAEQLFAGGTRTRLREYAEIPLDISARIVEHTGPLEITGSIPDGAALIVKDGGVTVHGQSGGSILAGGPIEVKGNIAGPWTVSTIGAVQCERVLGGANLYAPHAKIVCTAVERPGRIYSGVGIEVAQEVRGGTLIAPEITVGGAVRGAHLEVLRSVVCGALAGEPREPAQVVFRAMLSAEDYHAEAGDETWALAREVSRFRFREEVGRAMLACIRADFCNTLCARLYLAGGHAGADIKAMRAHGSRAAYLGVAIAIGEMLEQVILESVEARGDDEAYALTSGTDECQQAVKFLERDAGHLTDDLVRETKSLITMACKHLLNQAKKVRELGGNRAGMEEAVQTLIARLAEWREQRAAAAQALSGYLPELRTAIGADHVDETNPMRLMPAVNAASQGLGAAGLTPVMRALKVISERYLIGLQTYEQGAADVTSERERLESRLASDPTFIMGGGRRAPREVRAGSCGPHVVIAANPGLAVPAAGTDTPQTGRVLRVDRELPGAVHVQADGLLVRRDG